MTPVVTLFSRGYRRFLVINPLRSRTKIDWKGVYNTLVNLTLHFFMKFMGKGSNLTLKRRMHDIFSFRGHVTGGAARAPINHREVNKQKHVVAEFRFRNAKP